MATVKQFEELGIWQLSRELVKKVYKVTSTPSFRQDRPLTDQMTRSAVSIMSNIAEGFERDGKTEFRHFLSIAKGSCSELRSQLCVAADLG